MDGYVADYISCFTAEMGRQPTYEEYSQIMTGFTPEQIPVLNGLARSFGVFDHWFFGKKIAIEFRRLRGWPAQPNRARQEELPIADTALELGSLALPWGAR